MARLGPDRTRFPDGYENFPDLGVTGFFRFDKGRRVVSSWHGQQHPGRRDGGQRSLGVSTPYLTFEELRIILGLRRDPLARGEKKT
jgi:hypothetical protein